jgi:signal transduction histidine kinase
VLVIASPLEIDVKKWFSTSIRTRLLLVNIAIILVGFSTLTYFAGKEIESAIRADYEQQIQDQVRLIARSIGDQVQGADLSNATPASIDEMLKSYAGQVDGSLVLFFPEAPLGKSTTTMGRGGLPSSQDFPELEMAINGGTIVSRRQDAAGQDMLYTAAQLQYHGKSIIGLLQLAVPAKNLQTQILKSWGVLALSFILLTTVSLAAALWLARSITVPLLKLRDSALHLAQGDLSHRAEISNSDEIGEVSQAFNTMAAQVQAMLDEQQAFARNISHELRTPLTTLRLRTEALRYEKLDDVTAKRYLEEVDDEIIRLADVVQEVTLLSRFDSGRGQLGEDEIDIGRLLAVLCTQFQPLIQKQNIELALVGRDQSIIVHAGLSHLTVVLRNLLDNAFKYTPSGGQVTCSISSNEREVEICIQDTGQGITPEDLPHIFERFYRADKTASDDIPGTGLGLALVKSIVDAYGGQIHITSNGAGKGTTVMLLWPVK